MKNDLTINIIFFIISLITFFYIKYNNKNNKIEYYYLKQSKRSHKLFKISNYIINIYLIYNLKFILVSLFFKFI